MKTVLLGRRQGGGNPQSTKDESGNPTFLKERSVGLGSELFFLTLRSIGILL